MISFTSLLSTIVTLFLLLVTGYISGRLKIVDETASRKLSTLIVKVGQPFLIIDSLIGLEYSAENLKTGLLVLLLSTGMHTVMAGLAWCAAKPIGGLDERKLAEFAMIFSNCALSGSPFWSPFSAKSAFSTVLFISSASTYSTGPWGWRFWPGGGATSG